MAKKVKLRIGVILQERGIKVEDFANMAGINYRTALELANDRYQRIGKDTIAKVCYALQITPGDIFLLDEDVN